MVADRYNLNKLVDRVTRKEYQIDVANRFSALEGLQISSVDDTWFKIRDRNSIPSTFTNFKCGLGLERGPSSLVRTIG